MNKLLLPQDVVGGSFWLISVAMIGAAIFFFLERGRLSNRWGTAMNLVGNNSPDVLYTLLLCKEFMGFEWPGTYSFKIY